MRKLAQLCCHTFIYVTAEQWALVFCLRRFTRYEGECSAVLGGSG